MLFPFGPHRLYPSFVASVSLLLISMLVPKAGGAKGHYAKRSGAIWRQGSELLSVHTQDEAIPEGGQATNGTRYPHLPETIYCRRS